MGAVETLTDITELIVKDSQIEALEKVDGKHSRTADILRISRATVWNRMN
jgi:transcriptional regulator of acetoin/glycerol metabolism